jgi:hypothetical protein
MVDSVQHPKFIMWRQVANLESSALHGRGSEVIAYKPIHQYIQGDFFIGAYPWMHCIMTKPFTFIIARSIYNAQNLLKHKKTSLFCLPNYSTGI